MCKDTSILPFSREISRHTTVFNNEKFLGQDWVLGIIEEGYLWWCYYNNNTMKSCNEKALAKYSRFQKVTCSTNTTKNGIRNFLKHYGEENISQAIKEICVFLKLFDPKYRELRKCIIKFHGAKLDVKKQTISVASNYCSGGDLLDYVIRMKKIPYHVCLNIIIKIIDILEILEHHNIYHVDISLENFFFYCKNKVETLCLGDVESLRWGRLHEDLMFKLHTISPEQKRNMGNYDARAVMSWQLGCCIYTLMSGKRVFFATHQKLPPAEEECVWDGITDEIKYLLRHMLIRPANRRWTMKKIKDYVHTIVRRA
jgi:serine/threonine protein kinase